MRCRNIVNGNVIWFGSKGKNPDGTAIFENDQHESYVDRSEGTAASLTERLSVLKGELWYNISYGIPLIDKIKTKAEMDIFVAKIVTEHPDVTAIMNFESTFTKHEYTCSMTINTRFGVIGLSI